jgi:hypothetical protein
VTSECVCNQSDQRHHHFWQNSIPQVVSWLASEHNAAHEGYVWRLTAGEVVYIPRHFGVHEAPLFCTNENAAIFFMSVLQLDIIGTGIPVAFHPKQSQKLVGVEGSIPRITGNACILVLTIKRPLGVFRCQL